jgi:hypothetical protein
MNRARDYINFAVKFVGLGYVVLWPLSVTSTSGDVFGAALVCSGRFGAAVARLCDLPHVLRLSLGLHVVGALCAALALVHLAVLALNARRKTRAAAAAPAFKPKKPRFHLRPLPPPRKAGRPRKEFGLRGVPR